MDEQKAPRRVGDVAPSRGSLLEEQYHVRHLVGKELTITGTAEWEGDDGPHLAIHIEVDGAVGLFFSSHRAIFRKLLQCQDELPLLAIILGREGKASGRKYFDIE